MMYDTIIIGSGPAGITAGIYAARREMKALIIGREPGGQVVWASTVENYPGFKAIDSYELINRWQEHVDHLGVEIKHTDVGEIRKINNGFELFTSRESFKTKTIIIAMGLVPRRLSIPGEEKFTGKGISYCANCDSPLFRDKTVAVVGGGNSALDAAELLSKIAKKVYLIHRRQEFRGFEALVKEVKSKKNIELLLDFELVEIIGDEKVKQVKIKNSETNTLKEFIIDGIFIEIGRVAHTDLVADLADRNEQNQIIINEKCQVKTPGVFAAGDVTASPYKQITIATGQATVAALAAYEFLQLKQGKTPGPILDRSPLKAKK
jgi:thioredoxin-disulfide reductase